MVVYQPDRRRRVVLVLLVLTALALISFDERGSGTIDTARSAAADVIQPVRDGPVMRHSCSPTGSAPITASRTRRLPATRPP